jgi:hypothetical protein
MITRWVRSQSLLCGRGNSMDGFVSGSSKAFPAPIEFAAPWRTSAPKWVRSVRPDRNSIRRNPRSGLADRPYSRRVICLQSSRPGRAGQAASICVAALVAIHGILLGAGCSHAPMPVQPNLLERFTPAMSVADRRSFLNPVVVDRGGLKKNAMVLIAPVAAKAPLEGSRGRAELHFMVVPVFNVGDGIQMEIWLLDEGKSAQVFSRYFDPGRRFEDRRWTPVTVAMDLDREDVQLEIRVSAGPEGNLTGDWLAFADLSISTGAERR